MVYFTNMKAALVRYEKFIVQRRYTIEISVHQVNESAKYPDGLKWGLICFDNKTKKKVLFDNHHPKGPHIHLDGEELSYEFIDLDKLITDFRKMVLEHIGVKL